MDAEIVCLSQGPVAQVVLRHRSRMNAMTRVMWRQLRQAFLQLQADPAVRVVVLRGEDGHFCAGGDIAEYADFRFRSESLRDFHESDVWGALSAMLACDVPIVAQIQGNCMGAGLEIASCCDLRLASEDARFGAPIARLGFPMAPREAALVSRAVGESTARAMLLAAQVFDAPALLARGFLHEVLACGALAAASDRRVAQMSELAPQAARANKRTLRALAGQAPEALEHLVATAYDYADCGEHREGVSAFMQKRRPNFT